MAPKLSVHHSQFFLLNGLKYYLIFIYSNTYKNDNILKYIFKKFITLENICSIVINKKHVLMLFTYLFFLFLYLEGYSSIVAQDDRSSFSFADYYFCSFLIKNCFSVFITPIIMLLTCFFQLNVQIFNITVI